MSRSRAFRTAGLVLVSFALLIPAGSAHAAFGQVPFCGSLNPGNGYEPVTLRPGQACTFGPVAVNSVLAAWSVQQAGPPGGAVLLGVVQYPPGHPNAQPLNPTTCQPGGGNWVSLNPYSYGGWWRANNGFNACYGQPVLLNYTNYTIRTTPNAGGVWYYY
jgi:hypothetical protein